MLEIKNLSKKFGKKIALDNLEFNFDKGIYGLLGPNGSGKTTLIRCITGLYDVGKGSISYNGKPVNSKDYLSNVGYLPQNFGLFKELTCHEALLLIANLKGITKQAAEENVSEVLEQVNLSDVSSNKVSSLSGGMIRRLGIAQALLGDPDVIIFDEPTVGLDPEERLRFKNIILKLDKSKTIIISTHIVEDVEALCSNIAIMKSGKIIASGNCGKIAQLAENKVYIAAQEDIADIPPDCFTQKFFEQNGKNFVRVLSGSKLQYQKAVPTVEDGYLCALKGI